MTKRLVIEDELQFLTGAAGEMYYRAASGLYTPVAGTKSNGAVPTVQSDGSVAWAVPSGGGGGGAAVTARARHGSNVTLSTTGAWTAFPNLNTEDVDTDGMHSTVTNTGRLTVVTGGVYVLVAGWASTGGLSGVYGVGIRKNGTTLLATLQVVPGGNGVDVTTSCVASLVVTDYVEMCYYSANSAAAAVANSYSPRLEAVRVGA